jgi:hypothetical protein
MTAPIPTQTTTADAKALVIRAGTIERVHINIQNGSGQPDIHRLVGVGFGSCFVVPGSGRRRQVIGWCADDFEQTREPWNVVLSPEVYNSPAPGYPIKGTIVVTGVMAPDTVEMTELEMSAFHIVTEKKWSIGGSPPIPVLVFRPGYDLTDERAPR